MSLLPHIWTYVFKLHLIDLLSVCYTANFATNTVKNQHRLSHYTGWRGDFFLTPQLCIQNGSREQNHAHHPSAWTSYNQHVHQIWSLFVYSLQRCERWRKMQKLEWLGVRCHPWSSETSPLDRAHMTSYSTLIEIETMRLCFIVFEL